MAPTEVLVTDLNDFIVNVLAFSHGPERLWYRGIKDESYFFEPSAYHYKEYINDSGNLENMALTASKAEMFHVSETEKINNNIDWSCFIQHNGVPTRYLDWTFDLSVALYFAFENYILNTLDPSILPCIWCINIELFMKDYPDVARGELISKKYKPKEVDNVINFLKTSLSTGPDIPENLLEQLDELYFPFVAKIVNDRIRMQGGCFIRFPLLANQPEAIFDSYRLDVYAKKNKLDNYIKKFVFARPQKTFEELSILNLATSRIYPEVARIGKSIQIRNFKTFRY